MIGRWFEKLSSKLILIFMVIWAIDNTYVRSVAVAIAWRIVGRNEFRIMPVNDWCDLSF